MLTEGRIPLNTAEETALDGLVETHGNPVGFTRRDPGETGPVILTFPGRVFEIGENGEVKQLG